MTVRDKSAAASADDARLAGRANLYARHQAECAVVDAPAGAALLTMTAAEPRRLPLGRNDALVIVCASCDDDAPTSRLGPERGFEPSGGLPMAIEVRAGASLVLGNGKLGYGPANRRALNEVSVGLLDRTPGYLLVRVARKSPSGKPRDQRAAWLSLRHETWWSSARPIGSDARYFLFERPDPDARVKADAPDHYKELTRLSARGSR